MSLPARIAVLGFRPQERAALEAFFRLALKRMPPYERVADVAQADLIVIDADDDEQRGQVTEVHLAGRCVAVGERVLPGAALQMPRPLNVLRLFTRIDRLRYPSLDDGVVPSGAIGQATLPSSAAAAQNETPSTTPSPTLSSSSSSSLSPTSSPSSSTTPSALPSGPTVASESPAPPAPAAVLAPATSVPSSLPAPVAKTAAGALRGLARLTGRIRQLGGAAVAAANPSSRGAGSAGADAQESDFPNTESLVLPTDMARTVVLRPEDLASAGAAAEDGVASAPTLALAPPLLPAHERISLVGLSEAPEADTGTGEGAEVARANAGAFERTQPIERPWPAGPEDDDTPEAFAGEASAAPVAAKLQRVLVIDAEDEVLRFLVAELEPCGFALHAVRGGAEALDWVVARRYRHALVHVADGPESRKDRGVRLAAQLRLAAQDRGRQPPAVALFGSRQALVTALSREPKAFADVEAVLSLPLQRDELLDAFGGRSMPRSAFATTVPQSTLG